MGGSRRHFLRIIFGGDVGNIAGFMGFIHDDNAYVPKRHEQGGAGADDDGNFAVPGFFPLIYPLPHGKAAMGHADRIPKAGNKPLQNERGQGNFRHQNDGLLPFFQHFRNHLHINLRFAAAGDTVEQNGAFFFFIHFPADGIEGRRLFFRRRKGCGPFKIRRIENIAQFCLFPFPQDAFFQKGADGRIGDAKFFFQLRSRHLFAISEVFQNKPLALQPLIPFRFLPDCFQKGMLPIQRKQPFFFFICAMAKLLLQLQQALFLHFTQEIQGLSAKFHLHIIQRHIFPLADEIHQQFFLWRQFDLFRKIQQADHPTAFGAQPRRQDGLQALVQGAEIPFSHPSRQFQKFRREGRLPFIQHFDDILDLIPGHIRFFRERNDIALCSGVSSAKGHDDPNARTHGQPRRHGIIKQPVHGGVIQPHDYFCIHHFSPPYRKSP